MFNWQRIMDRELRGQASNGLAAILLAVAVTGCAAPATQDATDGAAAFETSREPVSAQEALNNFAVCINSAPTFADAAGQLSDMTFTQHPQTGTWYHDDLNLSIKLMSDRCSMVFSSPEEPAELGLILAVGSAMTNEDEKASVDLNPDTGAAGSMARGGAEFTFVPTGFIGEKPYFRAVITN